MLLFTDKSFFNTMSVRRNLQHLKALERAPHGTLAFRYCLLKRCKVIPHNKALDGLEFNIPLPPLPEQRRSAGILSAANRKLELERMRKEKLERVKMELMNELPRGKRV
jgi:restriction endonuclease S subunit